VPHLVLVGGSPLINKNDKKITKSSFKVSIGKKARNKDRLEV
jgi:hypothetical protein